MTCPTLETVATWVLDELPEKEAELFEEHYFGCDECFARAQRLEQLALDLRTGLPPILTAERHAKLQAERPSLPTVHVETGKSGTIRLGDKSSVGVWVLHCALEGVSRVDFESRSQSGTVFFAFEDVPFDAERGQVLLPCQIHYRALPVDRQFYARLSARDTQGARLLGEYFLDHEFDNL